jgi:hypothetical protein
MDLLYKHISNIPIKEQLVGIFIVDDNVHYVATQFKDSSKDADYRLYLVANYKISSFMGKAKMLSEFDMIIHKNLPHIIEQSAHNEDDLRIVKYKTFRKETTRIARNVEIVERNVNNRHKKLF